MRELPLVAAAVLLAVGVAGAPAQERLRYETRLLANGMRVILAEDHSVPIVTINLWYNVGSRDERLGRSGFAHLFEHMMFQGSAHVKKGEYLQLVERAGGSLNGTTNEDRTAYFETLPSNQLALGLWLEADRMRSLAITAENFENQRETVKEERRRAVDNRPYGHAFSDGPTLPFDSTACFPYAHSVIGSMDDLNAAELEDVQGFFDQHYGPNNATLTLVGDFELEPTHALVERYFGDIPPGPEREPVGCAVSFAAGAKRRVFDDPLAELPAVLVMYRIPSHSDDVTRPLQLLNTILGDGESSRLHRALVREARTALQAGVFVDSRRGPGVLLAYAIANQRVSADTLAAQLALQVERAAREDVTSDELDRARNEYRAAEIFGRQTTAQIAQQLQHYAHFHETIDEIESDLDRYMAVTAEEVRMAAERYLVEDNRYTVLVVPSRRASEDR
jgi:predicted Zn-dependent peptidase